MQNNARPYCNDVASLLQPRFLMYTDSEAGILPHDMSRCSGYRSSVCTSFFFFFFSKSVYKAHSVAYAEHADRDFAGARVERRTIGTRDEDGGGEKCEIKVSAGRYMTTVGREGRRDGGGGEGGEGGRRRSGVLISEHRRRSRLGIRASWMFN